MVRKAGVGRVTVHIQHQHRMIAAAFRDSPDFAEIATVALQASRLQRRVKEFHVEYSQSSNVNLIPPPESGTDGRSREGPPPSTALRRP